MLSSLSLAAESPVHSSSSSDFAALHYAELELADSDISFGEDQEDDGDDDDFRDRKTKRRKMEDLEVSNVDIDLPSYSTQFHTFSRSC